MRKTTKKKIAPIVITVAVVLYIGPLVLLLLGRFLDAQGGEPENQPRDAPHQKQHQHGDDYRGHIADADGGAESVLLPLAFLAAYLLLGGAVIVGVIKALLQRLDARCG